MEPKRKRQVGDAIESLAEDAVQAAEELDQRRGGDERGDPGRGRGDPDDDQERGGSDEDQGRGERGRG